MSINFDTNKYDELRAAVLERIPDAFTVNNSIIEEREYTATQTPIISTFYNYILNGSDSIYELSSGEKTTIDMWYTMLSYKEYDLLADLFILGFLNDDCDGGESSDYSISGRFYTRYEINWMMGIARNTLVKNNYGKHHHRCRTYLTLYNSEAFRKYEDAAWRKELKINSVDEFAQIMMEIITEAYSEMKFFIMRPSKESIKFANDMVRQALDKYYDDIFNRDNQC